MEMEWKSEDPRKAPAVPKEITDPLRYRFLFYGPQPGAQIDGWCESVSPSPLGGAQLNHVLVDTSERINGMTMTSRRTYHKMMILAGGAVVVYPLAEEEAR